MVYKPLSFTHLYLPQICFQMWDNGCTVADSPCCGALRTMTHKVSCKASECSQYCAPPPLLLWSPAHDDPQSVMQGQ